MATENNGWYQLERAKKFQSSDSQQTIRKRPTQQPQVAHSQTVGPRGPALMQDTALLETMEAFANAPYIRRIVHTKGFGAFGHFKPTASMQADTSAGFLQAPFKQTKVAVRFSLAASDDSTPDTSRNIRGMSVKFYTDDGIYDLLCNSIPVFFVRDAIKVPETIAALGPSPASHLPDPDQVWGMFARTPEATNLLTWFFSDVGTAKSFRTISYHSVSTYVWKNAEGQRRYVRYRWVPAAGEAYIGQEEAQRLACENPNIAGQDLYDTIASGEAVEFDLQVQLMDPADEAKLPFDPLDDTKIWDDALYPPRPVGRLTLNQNPEHYREQVEKLAFAPANLVRGIEFSDDKMLQGRAIVYAEAQRHRLGNDYRKIPVNQQADWSPSAANDSGDGRQIGGTIGRSAAPKQDDFTQAGQRYDAMAAQEKDNLTDQLAAGLSAASRENQQIVLGYLTQASPAMAEQVRQKIRPQGELFQLMTTKPE